MGGSDASCEDEDEEDSEEEDDEEELASTCGQDAESHDEWGFRGFRANRPLIPPRVLIRLPISYSTIDIDVDVDDDDDLGSMAVEPSSDDEEEDDKLDIVFSTIITRPSSSSSSSPLAMRPPSLPEGISRIRKPKTKDILYHPHYEKFNENISSYQGLLQNNDEDQNLNINININSNMNSNSNSNLNSNSLLMEGVEDMNADNEYHNIGTFVALADVAHGTGSNWLKRGTVAGAFGNRIDHIVDSDDSVATSLFVEVSVRVEFATHVFNFIILCSIICSSFFIFIFCIFDNFPFNKYYILVYDINLYIFF